MSDLCKHKWYEEKLGEPCPWCRIEELEADFDSLVDSLGEADSLADSLKRQRDEYKADNERLREALQELAEWEPVGEAGDSIEMKAFALAALEKDKGHCPSPQECYLNAGCCYGCKEVKDD